MIAASIEFGKLIRNRFIIKMTIKTDVSESQKCTFYSDSIKREVFFKK